jgi:two-component system, cell cycle sensor histidine kinase and response regulator CckA
VLVSPNAPSGTPFDQVVAVAWTNNQIPQLRQALQDSDRRFHAYMDALPFAVWLRDQDERYLYLNPMYLKVMHATAEEWYGKTVEEKWPPEVAAQFIANDHRCAETGEPIITEEVTTGVNGPPRVWLNTKFSFTDSEQRRYFGGMAIDVTEDRARQQRDRAMERRLLELQKSESLAQLASGLAHDFNNFLTVITGQASLARVMVQADDHPALPHLDSLEQAASEASELVNHLLGYARQAEPSLEVVPLAKFITDTQPMMQLMIKRRAALTLTCCAGSPAVRINKVQFRQVLLNLVLNAAEAVDPNQGSIQVELGEQHDPNTGQHFARVEVIDNGRGIPTEQLERVFEPFFTTKRAGRGLGLAAVRWIIHQFGGDIHATSQLGRGTTFHVRLPVLETTV